MFDRATLTSPKTAGERLITSTPNRRSWSQGDMGRLPTSRASPLTSRYYANRTGLTPLHPNGVLSMTAGASKLSTVRGPVADPTCGRDSRSPAGHLGTGSPPAIVDSLGPRPNFRHGASVVSDARCAHARLGSVVDWDRDHRNRRDHAVCIDPGGSARPGGERAAALTLDIRYTRRSCI